MDTKLREGFRIGDYDVEPLTGEIKGPHGSVRAQPKVMEVLLCLAEQSGQVVERDAIVASVWRRATSDEVLTRCISELRHAFADKRETPRYLQTVPKRGYRLLQPVRCRPLPASRGALDTELKPPVAESAVASVAVLPFDNLTNDAEHAVLADGIASELHSMLSRVDRLRVAARRSSLGYRNSTSDVREIASALDVRYIISGSVLCRGNHVRVITELDDAREGVQLWSQIYDRKVDDIFVVEGEIAESIASAFGGERLRNEIVQALACPTASLDAWGLVQKARGYLLENSAQALDSAMTLLERAIGFDRDYAAAHAMRAAVLGAQLINGLSDRHELEEAALSAAQTAHHLAPDDPFILKLAGVVWAYCGHYRQSLTALRRAVRLTPFDFGAWGYMGWPLVATGEPGDLTQLHGILDRILDSTPRHPGMSYWLYHKSAAYTCEGDDRAAAKLAEESVQRQPNFSLAWLQYANALAQLGDHEAARRAIATAGSINEAMTPEHYARLMRTMSDIEGVVQRRLGGLRSARSTVD